MNLRKLLKLIVILAIAELLIYYFSPADTIPEGVIIDKIIVLKSERKLFAYSNGKEVAKYTIAMGEAGNKMYEGDRKTPEGFYTINLKNPNSNFYKALVISYPNQEDMLRASKLNKPAGGDIEIHGLKNGMGYIGKFHCWINWTNGCIALTNKEMDQLYAHTPAGTPIEIRR
ncbi:MAG TPA: L,D-transpeptidase family protein [Chitinophagaceae bacterium]|nr:L,D-transpeptidase family protein [Chitinophagaceae bacterium]